MYNHYMLVKHGLKECAKCHNDYHIDAFGMDKTRPDGRAVYCKECRKKCASTGYKVSTPDGNQ